MPRGRDALLLLAVAVLVGGLLLLVERGRQPAEPGPEPAAVPRAAEPAEPGRRGAPPAGPDARAPAGDRVAAEAPAGAPPLPPDVSDPFGRQAPQSPEPADRPGPGPSLVAPTPAEAPAAAGPLAISGRVLDERGAPVAGLRIRALPQGGPDRSERIARSQRNGDFRVEGLFAGDVELATPETARHPALTKVVRAGSEAVDLVLSPRVGVRVHGRVLDARGAPVPGASVRALGFPEATVDDQGRYELAVDTGASRRLLVRFEAPGYRPVEERLGAAAATGAEVELDATLLPLGETFAVEGRLLSSQGPAVPGQAVELRSRELGSLRGVSDAEGRFRIEGVVGGSDWWLLVQPAEGFADHREGPLTLASGGASREIVLEEIATGLVAGRIMDPDGRGLPGFQLLLGNPRARTRSVDVTADAGGHFRVEAVPAGSLHFSTRSLPSLRVTGATLEGPRLDLEVMVDWGEESLTGRVVDVEGRPLAGADVRLTWNGRHGGLLSTSFRRATSDADGSFRFEQLGRVRHRIEVRLPGHARLRRGVEPGEDRLELRLRADK